MGKGKRGARDPIRASQKLPEPRAILKKIESQEMIKCVGSRYTEVLGLPAPFPWAYLAGTEPFS